MAYFVIFVQIVIGATFARAALSKLAGHQPWSEFVSSVSGLRVVPLAAVPVVAASIAAVELLTPVLIAVPITTSAGLVVAGAVLAGFAVVIGVAVHHGALEPCRCFGASKTPLGFGHAWRNVGLSVLAISAALAAGSTSGPVEAAGIAITSLLALAVLVVLALLDDLRDLLVAPDRGTPAQSIGGGRL